MRVLLIIAIALISAAGQAWHVSDRFPNNHIRSWSIYRNQRFGFSIKYPASWQADGHEREYNPIVIIYPRNPKPHEFYITVSIEDGTLDQVRESFAEFTRRSPGSQFKEREILFANERAYQFTRTDNPGFYAVYIPFSDKIYIVSAVRFDISEVRRSVRTFNLRQG
jgi:hypothetical protein